MSTPLRANISRGNPDKVFDLIEKVGGGTYGDVFKARVIATGELSAVKVVKIEPGDDFELIQQEIAMMQHCQHPNIIQYMGSYLRRDKLWIAMEFCGGGSVQDIYCVTGPCSESQISFICVETLKGLAYLHEKSLMHRDIKGANILLTTQGSVKLADFGIAARISDTLAKRKSFIGTPYWMAPEMAAVERTGGYDLKCDIWAVGITAIELAELQPPMFDLHPMRALYMIGKRSFVPPTLKEKDKWSVELHNFIKAALTKNPKKRPTADKMLMMPFCCHGYTKAVTQDLMDTFKAKSQKKGNRLRQQEEEEEDEEDVVDENVQVLTRIRSTKAVEKNNDKSSMPTDGKLDGVQVEHETSTHDQTHNGSEKAVNGEVAMNNDEDSGTMKVHQEAGEEEQPPPLPPKQHQRNSHYQVPQSSLKSKPVPPPKPGHLKVVRALSNQETKAVPERQRKFSDADAINRVPPPNVPPPKPPVGARSSDPGRPSAARRASQVTTCFSKIFNECPLHIYCTGLWVNPNTREKYIIVGAEEGIYSLNFSEQLHEAEMEQISARRCTWLSIFQSHMVSLQGSPNCVYMQNLDTLHDRQAFFQTVARNNRMSETRGCTKCCIVNNPYNSQTYLCVAMQKSVLLYQWYEPWHRFMKVQYYDVDIPSPPPLFEPLVISDLEYPLICVGVKKKSDGDLHFDCVNLNSLSNWFVDEPTGEKINADTVDHLEKDTVLVAFDKVVRFVSLEGKLKQFRRQLSEIHFDIKPESVVCLQGSVLAFHEHGLQGRSLHSGKINQLTSQDLGRACAPADYKNIEELIEDPVKEEKERRRKAVEKWTKESNDKFASGLATYGKRFRKLAEPLPEMWTAQEQIKSEHSLVSSGEKTDGSSSSNVNQTSEGKPKASLHDPHTSSSTPFEPTPGSRTCEPSHITENRKFKMPSVDREKESDVILSE
ncbi:mitogen-activated protein kinase kinase kinase kinase 5-like isoform X2 [Porites lutea]|uniref:mitogen-activated protein kinase kinase kinase kinase 5-like isoform X2 n=1 Tax=Porites lutea TaxID=51062 RepID=UPI003CC6A451